MNSKEGKSRNGCLTCKRRRVKCDETKPTCLRCRRVHATCEGYQGKEYRWRVFKDVNLDSDTQRPRKRSSCHVHTLVSPAKPSSTLSADMDSAFVEAALAFSNPERVLQDGVEGIRNELFDPQIIDLDDITTQLSPMSSDQSSGISITHENGYTSQSSSPDSFTNNSASAPDRTTSSEKSSQYFATSIEAISPPRLSEAVDILFPGDFDYNLPMLSLDLEHPLSYSSDINTSSIDEAMPRLEAVEEQVSRQLKTPDIPSLQFDSWFMVPQTPKMAPLDQPKLGAFTPEMLMLRFDKQTCSILSVKDGPTENPWRTLIWPLAHNSQALYYAITSMTAFHGSYDNPSLVAHGKEFEGQSKSILDMQLDDMSDNAAIATLLVLGFAESWKCPESTATQYLHKARRLVTKAIMQDQGIMKFLGSMSEEAMRLRYLCNTYVYMDVISRLTCSDEDEDLTSEILSAVNYPTQGLIEVDPLLGSAVSLFPLIGKVANLIHKVRRLKRISLALVSRAYDLQRQLQQWKAPSPTMLECLADSTEVLNTIQTAEALRYATLLFLYQAVPDLPSLSSSELARKVLTKLATTPIMSRATNIQIFPLFAASCEVTDEDDRNWVKKRWEALISRLRVKNVVRSWEIVQEVWSRRDAHEAKKAERLGPNCLSELDIVAAQSDIDMSVSSSINANEYVFDHINADKTFTPRTPTKFFEVSAEELDEEHTVRGDLHWLRVMKDRQWQGTVPPEIQLSEE